MGFVVPCLLLVHAPMHPALRVEFLSLYSCMPLMSSNTCGFNFMCECVRVNESCAVSNCPSAGQAQQIRCRYGHKVVPFIGGTCLSAAFDNWEAFMKNFEGEHRRCAPSCRRAFTRK